MKEIKVVDITGGKGVIYGEYAELLKLKKTIEEKVKAPVYATIDEIDDRFKVLTQELDKFRKSVTSNFALLEKSASGNETPASQVISFDDAYAIRSNAPVVQTLNPAYRKIGREEVRRLIKLFAGKREDEWLSQNDYRNAYELLKRRTGYDVRAQPKLRSKDSLIARIEYNGMLNQFASVLKTAINE